MSIKNNILRAIAEGVQNAINFNLDSFNDEDGYIKKKKNIESSEFDKNIRYDYLESNWLKHSPILLGDILYNNFEMQDGRLLSLGYKDGDNALGICVIPCMLPDHEIRFTSFDTFNSVKWGSAFSENNNVETLKHFAAISGMSKDFIILPNKNIISYIHNDCTSDILEKEYMCYPAFRNIGDTYEIHKSWLKKIACNENNALSDFCGWENTNKILECFSGSEFAAKYCKNYIPVNDVDLKTKGLWYLPALGELGILILLMHNNEKINSIIMPYSLYWTSTQYSDIHAYGIGTTVGNKTKRILPTFKQDDYYKCMPFIHFKLHENFKR